MLSFTPHIDGWYDVADQVRADLARRADAHFAARRREKDALSTVAAFEAHRKGVRAHFLKSIGGLPAEKTPLRPRVTGVVTCDGYKVEKLLYESVSDYLVTAACYVPDNLEGPAPAVLFFCGHAAEGKAYVTYQRVCIDLVNNGFIVLAIDPIGQGERLQYWRDGRPGFDACIVEHTHAGVPFFVQGSSVARHFIWDGVRGLDYLESRPDVDADRIGATGNSGGGMQLAYLMMCEPRLAAAVPCTFLTSLEAVLKSGNPQDMEQIVPGCMVHGPDHDDFLTALAPRPVLAGAVAYDFFPIEGTRESVCRARRIYDLYGKSENLGLAVDDSLHCYSDGLRQACVNWFKVHLRGESPDFITSGPPILPVEALWATASGQVLTDFPQSKSIFDLNCASLNALPVPSADPVELRAALDERLGVWRSGSRTAPIAPRLLEPRLLEDGTIVQKLWFFSSPDVAVSGVLLHPPGAGAAALPLTLLVSGDVTAATTDTHIQELLLANRRVFVFDPRGRGGVASRSVSALDGNADFAPPFDTEYKVACDAAMLGLSSLGLRVFDVLRAFDYLRSRSDVAEITLHGRGTGAFWAYFATVLEPGVSAVVCEDMLLSYRELCDTQFYDGRAWTLAAMAHGLLGAGDLADFLPCIAGRPMSLLTPRHAAGHILSNAEWGPFSPVHASLP